MTPSSMNSLLIQQCVATTLFPPDLDSRGHLQSSVGQGESANAGGGTWNLSLTPYSFMCGFGTKLSESKTHLGQLHCTEQSTHKANACVTTKKITQSLGSKDRITLERPYLISKDGVEPLEGASSQKSPIHPPYMLWQTLKRNFGFAVTQNTELIAHGRP